MSLFRDGNVVHCGLTAMMLVHLRTPHTMLLHGRTPKTIGSSDGVPQAVIDRCLARMRTWLRLALDVVQAEWPMFEIVQAMTVFNLSSVVKESSRTFFSDASTSKAACIVRLAGFLHIDAASLQIEYDNLLQSAEHQMKTAHCKSSLEAWRLTIQRCHDRRMVGTNRWRCDTLIQVLQLYAATTVTTSGLEQSFSHVERLFGARRQSMASQMRNDIHEVTSCSDDTFDIIVAIALDVWRENYGSARAPADQRKPRLDAGHAKATACCIDDIGTSGAPMSRKAFLGFRKECVNSLTTQSWSLPDALAEMKAMTIGDWTARMQKEETFNDTKFVRAAIEACQQNAALPSEAALLQGVVAEHVQQRAKRKHERQLEQARRTRCFREARQVEFRQKPVYMDIVDLDHMVQASGAADVFLRGLASQIGATGGLADHPVAAADGLFVVRDPASPPIVVLLVASLTGGAVMDLEYFQTSGHSGSNISYVAGVKVKRTIFISDAAKTAAPELTTIIHSIITAFAGSNWRIRAHEPSADVLAANSLAIVSTNEKQMHPEFSNCRYAFDMPEFIVFVQKFDLETCTAGLSRK